MTQIENIISDAILDAATESEGYFDIEIEDGENTINVRGYYETDGYCEDDYFSGTGAWVTTYCNVSIIEVTAYNEDGDEITFTFSINVTEVENAVEMMMAA